MPHATNMSLTLDCISLVTYCNGQQQRLLES